MRLEFAPRTRTLVAAAIALATLGVATPAAADPAKCKKIRFADVGWTDITATTGVATEILHGLGYETGIDLLSVPVTFMSLKNGDIDVFLGNWMPTMTADIKPFLDTGAVVDLGINLDGALYTLAVPKYVYDAGVKSAADLAKNAAKFKKKIYGIEPGNDGNRTVQGMIDKNTYGLTGWKVVESSEQGMLGEVRRAAVKKEWIVFLGWKPHPMNTVIDMAYLADPSEVWGPGGGASTVHTIISKDFASRCPEVIALLKEMKFTVDMENRLMGRILDDKIDPAVAAREWIKANATIVAGWTQAMTGGAAAPPAAAPVALGTGPDKPPPPNPACKKIRFSDVGWTDITATTGVTTEVLHDLGYETHIDLLSVPVTFMSLKNDDIDVFLGNWMPTMTADIKPFLDAGSVVDLGINLDGALYTLAVPTYVYDAGVKSAADLAKNAARFKKRIYGIEPGNDGNRTVQGMIDKNTYGLTGWKVVESSEQGMLGEVRRAAAAKEWIVFLGWKPHPMNTVIDMSYLADPSEVWGPGGGASTVHTIVNKSFASRCPEVIALLKEIKFTVDMENRLMGRILDDKLEPAVAAREWINANPALVAAWTKVLQPAPPADAQPPAGTVTKPKPKPPSAACKKIRFADVGWTDITATTGVATEILHDLGYETHIDLLSVPVTFMSLKNDDIDVFLGNWMPTMTADIKPFLDAGSVVDLGINLDGALYTLAVPKYVHDAGVKSAADLAKNAARFKKQIYGIEPGNDGNRTVQGMIDKNTYGLTGWKVVESSEQGMLGEVRRAVASKEWIVFLGWKPHPMNTLVDMAYLADPSEVWGPGGGASTVHTIVNKNFASRCPEVVGLLKEMKFTVDMENRLMGRILDDKVDPAVAAREWINANPGLVASWTRSLMAPAADPGKPAVADNTQTPPPITDSGNKIPLGKWIESVINGITSSLSQHLRGVTKAVTWLIEGMISLFGGIPPLVLIVLLALLSFAMQRRIGLSIGVVAGTALIWNLGYWQATIETLALVISSTFVCVVVGVPTGILAARRPRFNIVLRVILDLMQTIPTFVYLIPALMLFGLGIVPGILATIVFAVPGTIRLTHLGISNVPREVIEAGDSFGARPMQRLFKIEIPYALPTIMEGVTQALMLSLSMVVIAALVGGGGLGAIVVRALNTVNIAQGFEAGLSIVILAILLDRAFRYRGRHERP